MRMISELKKELKEKATKEIAEGTQRFFKTNKGQYGEDDIFLGIPVPTQRQIAKKYRDLKLNQLEKLIKSKIHEHRSISLIILCAQYEKGKEDRNKIADFYLKNIKGINNWDLVDISAPHILGKHLLDKDKKTLYKLAKSKNLWQKRIAIVATSQFIKNNKFEDTFKISEILINDNHDLIHKAVGWMLREVGNRSIKDEEFFLKERYKKMPRTMLRYAIEKFPEKKRLSYLKGEI